MKSNLRRKLFMSLAATAACAATLTSTTFAWYTTNTEVDVTTIQGATSAEADTTSIFIASAETYDGHVPTKFSTYGAQATVKYTGGASGIEMKPVWYDTLGTTYSYADSVTADTEKVEGKKYFARSGSAEAGYVYTDKTNDTTDPKTEGLYEGTKVMNGEFKSITGETASNSYTYTKVNTSTASPVSTATYYIVNQGAAAPTGDQEGTTGVASWDTNKDYYTREVSTSYTTTYKAATTKDYVEFVIRLKTSATATNSKSIYLSKFDLKNTKKNNLPTQDALAYNGDGVTNTGVEKNGAYGADLLKALKMNVYTTAITATAGEGAAAGTTVFTRGADSETKVYAFESYDATEISADINIDSTNKANAVGYYNRVMGTHIATPNVAGGYNGGIETKKDATAGTSDTPLCTMTSDYIELHFTLYLDGWDSYCYDVMMQQGFTLDLGFTTSASKNILKLTASE